MLHLLTAACGTGLPNRDVRIHGEVLEDKRTYRRPRNQSVVSSPSLLGHDPLGRVA